MEDNTKQADIEYAYLEGYMDASSDILDALARVKETPELYRIKEAIRVALNRGE